MLAIVVSLTVGACGSQEPEPAPPTPAPTAARDCSTERLATLTITPGKLTIATGRTAQAPYFADGDPTNGRGFESAVAYAIAEKLGFAGGEVRWMTVPPRSAYAPGAKPFDLDVDQLRISMRREQDVDFSAPYYTAPQAIVALHGSDAASATTLADLREARLGIRARSPSVQAVDAAIRPDRRPRLFRDAGEAVHALEADRVDAIVVDLPTAVSLRDAAVERAKVVGQFDAPGGVRWGAVLAKGSALTPCVDRAIGELVASDELEILTKQWMSASAGAPQLR